MFDKILLITLASIICCSCQADVATTSLPEPIVVTDTLPGHDILTTRFNPPAGATRQTDSAGFAVFIRHLPLLPAEHQVRLYNGRLKSRTDVASAVFNIDVGTEDLQQCADAVMRIRAEYLWKQQQYADIHFNFTNGFRCDYLKWRNGYRVKVSGNNVVWEKRAAVSDTYQTFREYLRMVFMYAGTRSLEKELTPVTMPQQNVKIGDVIIQGGSPGHALLVVDVAENKQTGMRYVMLAQSYMPAQEIHILRNLQNTTLSPWFEVASDGTLQSPEWDFDWAKDVRRF
jgi:hypothetical protein